METDTSAKNLRQMYERFPGIKQQICALCKKKVTKNDDSGYIQPGTRDIFVGLFHFKCVEKYGGVDGSGYQRFCNNVMNDEKVVPFIKHLWNPHTINWEMREN